MLQPLPVQQPLPLLCAINSDTPVSPVPYAVGPHMDIKAARMKVLPRRIVIYKSELPTYNRTQGPMPKYLQIRQFIEAALQLKKNSVATLCKHLNGTMQCAICTLHSPILLVLFQTSN